MLSRFASEEVGRRVRRRGHRAERRLERRPLLDEGLARRDEVVERADQVGGGRVVDVGRRRQPVDHREEVGQRGVDALEVLVELHQGAAQLLARGRRGPARSPRGCPRASAAARRVSTGSRLFSTCSVSVAFCDRSWLMTSPSCSGRERRVRRDVQRDVALAEQRLRDEHRGDVARDRGDRVGVDGHLDRGLLAVRLDRLDLADDDAADLHVALLGELVADGVGLQRHHVDGLEDLVEVQQAPGDDQDHHQEQHEAGEAAPGRRQRRAEVLRRRGHPAIRIDVVVPQIARVSRLSRTVKTTIELRTALPTATPTPAGPPPAL